MKIHILGLLLALLVLTAHSAEDRNSAQNDDDDEDDEDDITSLTFLIEYEPEEDNDLIEIGLTVEAKDRSLKQAIRKASAVVDDITEVAESFCKTPAEG